ncbi:hypothetical protein [Limnoraphis robusta]|uniref:Uncharacterized protein n=1 Tax=Limnoraphis robusta CCNP1315 TaxID=3110306 RepID=A0ABU5TR06_9CYAN|nr:hypothetical protein [Limnoraphis robusta]MEA5517360.1 hypothetical protein [Limnoraphis robusta CCNP1315]MEA5546051.1 hypothetical protein [Limnoraphis robusta CCNP1324]
MFFSKFVKIATATLFFSNPVLLESLQTYRFPFIESTAQAQTVLIPSEQIATKQWQTLTSREANFSVLIPPGNPQQETLEESSGQFQYQIQRFMLSDEKGIYYLVAYTDNLPFLPTSLTADQADIFYDSFTQGILSKDPQAKVLSQREITLKGVLGQEIEVETSNGVLLKLRVFVANSRIYILMAGINTPSLAKSQNVAQFFDSFDLVNHQAPVVSQKQTSKKQTKVYSIEQSIRLK